MSDLKEKKEKGGNYNFREEKSEILFEFVTKYPCLENVLVNTKHLERTFKYLKKLLKNQYNPEHMNDFVLNELKPNDLKHSWHTYGFKGHSIEGNNQTIHKMYSEKIWEELLSYSSQEFPIKDFKTLP